MSDRRLRLSIRPIPSDTKVPFSALMVHIVLIKALIVTYTIKQSPFTITVIGSPFVSQNTSPTSGILSSVPRSKTFPRRLVISSFSVSMVSSYMP